MSLISEVADAVAGELSAQTFTPAFKTIRAYRHDQTLPDGKELKVSVVPKGMTVTPAARTLCRYDLEIFVAVMRKVDRAHPADIDPLLGLVTDIVDFFRLRRLEQFPDAMWVGTEIKPMVSTDHLETLKQFTSLITLTYKVTR